MWEDDLAHFKSRLNNLSAEIALVSGCLMEQLT